ncbi:hypothetical protein M8J75_000914 [Diaphorina citri]|nr:hypothetical protein M8J75_000914 [Diaphorina citri]
MRMESISELQVPLIRIIDDNDVAILHVAEDEAPSRDKYEDQPPLQAPAVFMHTLDVPGQSYVVTAQRRQDSYRVSKEIFAPNRKVPKFASEDSEPNDRLTERE